MVHNKQRDLFPLFTTAMFGPEPGESIDEQGLAETLEYIGLNPEDEYVLASFKRWWSFYGGSLEQPALI